MSKKASKPRKGRPAKGIPFIAVLGAAGWERNARLELQNPRAKPELRAQIERYLANPYQAAAQDQETREKVFNDLLDDAVHHTSVGSQNLARHSKRQTAKAEADALKAVAAWRNDAVRCSQLSSLSQVDVVLKYLNQRVKPPRRQADRLRSMMEAGRIK